jgi:two-component system cell cycle sensor histidine kinase/response regulator CckA
MIGGLDRRERDGCSKVLVFDDEPMILELLATVLQREGYRVTVTRRKDEALQLVSNLGYDLAVTDLGIRKSDGRRLVSEIRRVSPGTPIVAMTAYPAAEIVTFAETHAEALLTKPFGIGELLSAVRRVLDGNAVGGTRSSSGLASGQKAPALAVSTP